MHQQQQAHGSTGENDRAEVEVSGGSTTMAARLLLAACAAAVTGGIRPYAPRQAQYDTWSGGIPRAYMGMMPGHTCAIVGIVRGSVI